MFSADKILGGLLQNSLGKSSGFGLKGGIAMGALGVAMEAASHYLERGKSEAPPAAPPSPAQTPPPPPGTAPSAAGPAPPPPPGTTAPPPLAAPGSAAAATQDEAVVLIRAMIAAANADGTIDAEERQRILGQLQKLDLSTEEQSFVLNELLNPGGLDQVVAQVSSPELGRQVYAVSLMAIIVDTEAEHEYMNALASRLGLSPEEVQRIASEIGI